MKHHLNGKCLALVMCLAAGTVTSALAATIQLNGQPLNTSVAPVTYGGRLLVPMRDIFEALGAKVDWNELTQGITATRGATKVEMQMGRSNAIVNGQSVHLDQAPMAVHGRTMVPLRFVSEALGAKVDWNGTLQVVSIEAAGAVAGGGTTGGTTGGGTAVAGSREIRIPSGVIIPVLLDQALSSATARAGERFTATVKSERLGDSEFPAGTKIEGVITQALPKRGDEPGVLDLSFDAAMLPDGTRYPMQGSLTSLDAKSVKINANGHLVAINKKSDKLKVIGIGAGLGYVVGHVLLKKNGAISAVLGALGGYLYDAQRNKNKAAEAVVPAGAEIGVRLDSAVAYRDTSNYAPARRDNMRLRVQ